MDICIFDGVASGHHHAVSEIQPDMAHAGGVVSAFEKDQITGFGFRFGNMLALIPQAVCGGAPNIITSLIVDPADIAGAIKACFRGRAAPDVGRANIFFCFLIDGGKLTVCQSFRRNGVVDAGCAGAIRATGRQSTIEQIRSAAQRFLKDLIAFPLIVVQFLPDNDL